MKPPRNRGFRRALGELPSVILFGSIARAIRNRLRHASIARTIRTGAIAPHVVM